MKDNIKINNEMKRQKRERLNVKIRKMEWQWQEIDEWMMIHEILWWNGDSANIQKENKLYTIMKFITRDNWSNSSHQNITLFSKKILH